MCELEQLFVEWTACFSSLEPESINLGDVSIKATRYL